jgi:hypothetical protein
VQGRQTIHPRVETLSLALSSSDRGRGRKSPPSTVKGITVVNPKPDRDIRRARPLELQKLDKIHRFWPILKSSVQYNNPVEKVSGITDSKRETGRTIHFSDNMSGVMYNV